MGGSLEVSTFSVDKTVLGSLGRQHNHGQDCPFVRSIFEPCGFYAVPCRSAPFVSEALESPEGQEYFPVHTVELVFMPIKWANDEALAAVGLWG